MEIKPQPKDMRELMIQHNQRFAIQTTMGEVVLKRIPYLDNERIVYEIIEDDPEYGLAIEKVMGFNELAMNQRNLIIAWENAGKIGDRPVDFPDQFLQERMWARTKVAKHNWRKYGPCFEKPEINTKADLDLFMNNLEPNEREGLCYMLVALISPLADTQKNLSMLAIAKTYGIKWAGDLFATNMTLQQAEAILMSEKAENDAGLQLLEKAMEGR